MSQGNEPLYVQMWLIETLAADPYLLASVVQGRIYETPGPIAKLPALVVAATTEQTTSESQSRHRNMVEVIFVVAAIAEGDDLLVVLPVADRADVLLSRIRNLVWQSPVVAGLPGGDQYQQELTIYSIARSYSVPERPSEGDQVFRSINMTWRIRCSVALTGDVTA